MKAELWQNPYNWTAESEKIKFDLIKFFEGAAQAKRLQIDPFEEVVKIRCTQPRCKERYSVKLEAFSNLAQNSGFDSLRFLAPGHGHFFQEINLRDNGTSYCKNLSISQTLKICKYCYKPCPFPFAGYSWDHHCPSGNWSIRLGKPNTLSWKGSAWIGLINYDHQLWAHLLQVCTYDEAGVGWICKDDAQADSFEKACKQSPFFGPLFRRLPKPKINPNSAGPRGMINSQKALAAMSVLQAIPPEFLPKVKKAIQSALHPDRDPQNKEALTKAFQNFEEAWRKWEGK